MRISSLSLSLLIETIQDKLSDLMSDGLVSESVYARKSVVPYLVDAINKLDIKLCLQYKPKAFVGLYIPEGIKQIPLFYQSKYSGLDVVQRLQNEQQLANPFVGDYWLVDTLHFDVSEIHSSVIRFVPLYDLGGANAVSFRSVPADVFSNTNQTEKKAFIDPNNKRLFLSEAVDSDGFLLVEAVLLPARIDITDFDFDNMDSSYTVRVAVEGEDALVQGVLREILPITVREKTDIDQRYVEAIGLWLNNKPATGPRVVIPETDYGFTS